MEMVTVVLRFSDNEVYTDSVWFDNDLAATYVTQMNEKVKLSNLGVQWGYGDLTYFEVRKTPIVKSFHNEE